MRVSIEHIIRKLIQYIEKEDFRGYDPYDALNSPILNLLSKHSKLLRIIFTQSLRRLPVNLRPLLGIHKDLNPKGVGLFLSSYVKLYKLYRDSKYLNRIEYFADWLIKNRSVGYSGCCWGYNFDWQNRAFFAPKGTPTIVNTAFIGHAFLDTYEILKNQEYLNIARSACDFIMNDLNIYDTADGICFSYTPLDNSKVHNANYLGASLLIRTYSFTREPVLLDYAKKAYEYSNKKQNNDGSWFYGEAEYQKWIDSFHTGFNLEALYIYEKCTNSKDYELNIQKGLNFYLNNFFLDDGTPKYYHNSTYPIDIHCPAQALVTLSKLKNYEERSSEILKKVLNWTIENMYDEKGFFYFRRGKIIKNKISYIRWAQAWMLRGLVNFLCNA